MSAALPRLTRSSFAQLGGWQGADLEQSLQAMQRSAREMLRDGSGFRRVAAFGGTIEHWREACEQSLNAMDAKSYFETHFVPCRVQDLGRPEGLFTGYFEPLVEGTRVASPDYPVPVYRKPDDLVSFSAQQEAQIGLRYGRITDGKPQPYFTRKDIEQGALAGLGLEICWLKDWADAFFMHVQGQGRVHLQEGGQMRLSYAAKAGHPYTGIGGVLAARGVLTHKTMSMQTVRAWMAEHPAEARELMWQNESYIFFSETAVDDESLGGIGAAKVNLTPRVSLAVDRSLWMFGTPLWIDTHYPPEANQPEKLQRLMIAQDTGTAIRGAVRGDFFWGWGEDAALIAGHMKSQGKMTALLPKALAQHLGL